MAVTMIAVLVMATSVVASWRVSSGFLTLAKGLLALARRFEGRLVDPLLAHELGL